MISDLTDQKIKFLEEKSNKARELVIEMLLQAGSGHSAGPLGMADIFTTLYFHAMNHMPQNPEWEERDRLILSNGHICPIRYTVMALAGYFPIGELKTLRKFGSRLQGHPHRTALPGLETTSGPLGEGLSQAAGMAIARDLDNKKYNIYTIVSDGEFEEGNSWEAMMFIGKNKFQNFIIIMDRNNIQIDGRTEDIMPLEPLVDKCKAFGLHVIEIDGNNIREINDAIMEAKAVTEKSTMIIANTIPGKGVDFMEGNYLWHGKPPNQEEAKNALQQLKTLGNKIEHSDN